MKNAINSESPEMNLNSNLQTFLLFYTEKLNHKHSVSCNCQHPLQGPGRVLWCWSWSVRALATALAAAHCKAHRHSVGHKNLLRLQSWRKPQASVITRLCCWCPE